MKVAEFREITEDMLRLWDAWWGFKKFLPSRYAQ